MDPTGPTARRFPLIARPRPACVPLPQRIDNLRELAITAAKHRDLAKATAVFNLGALIASDCGSPELARQWCHRLARTTLRHHPTNPRLGLEPIVNLARLHTRAGDGLTAWHLLDTLNSATASRTDTTIDGIHIPIAELTTTPDTHHDLRAWLWSVLLADGSRALATAGHWQTAHHKLQQLHGIGQRMLDGRQIAVLAHATTGHHHQALTLLRDTQPGQQWETAVTACLTLLCQPGHTAPTTYANLLTPYHALDPTTVGPVFHTRLGLCILDRLHDLHPPTAHELTTDLIHNASTDGYAARDVLTDPRCHTTATEPQIRTLTQLVETCGLDQGTLPDDTRTHLSATLDIAEEVIA